MRLRLAAAGLLAAALLASGAPTAPPAGAQTPAPAPDAAASPPAPAVAAPVSLPTAPGAYRLNPGDVLRVSVWREEGLDRELVVQPDGTVSFPLAAQLDAAGRSAGELEAALAARLERFIPGPVVTVELLEARGNVAYVIGEVNKPGAFQLVQPSTVTQVLALAGGFTPFAGKGRIRVVRRPEGAGGPETVIPFDYNDVAGGRAPEGDLPVRAGDTIVVPGGALF